MPYKRSIEPNAEVVSIDQARSRRLTEPPPTSDEIREWREIRPQVLRMLQEWDMVRTACPLASKIINGE